DRPARRGPGRSGRRGLPMIRTLATLATILLVPLPGWAECSVELSPVTFGTVDTRENSRGTGEVVVRCDAASGFEIAISGAGSGGNRRMDGPSGSRLGYRLFADA